MDIIVEFHSISKLHDASLICPPLCTVMNSSSFSLLMIVFKLVN